MKAYFKTGLQVACYFLVIENDKNKVLEMGEITQKVQVFLSRVSHISTV